MHLQVEEGALGGDALGLLGLQALLALEHLLREGLQEDVVHAVGAAVLGGPWAPVDHARAPLAGHAVPGQGEGEPVQGGDRRGLHR